MPDGALLDLVIAAVVFCLALFGLTRTPTARLALPAPPEPAPLLPSGPDENSGAQEAVVSPIAVGAGEVIATISGVAPVHRLAPAEAVRVVEDTTDIPRVRRPGDSYRPEGDRSLDALNGFTED